LIGHAKNSKSNGVFGEKNQKRKKYISVLPTIVLDLGQEGNKDQEKGNCHKPRALRREVVTLPERKSSNSTAPTPSNREEKTECTERVQEKDEFGRGMQAAKIQLFWSQGEEKKGDSKNQLKKQRDIKSFGHFRKSQGEKSVHKGVSITRTHCKRRTKGVRKNVASNSEMTV